MAVVVVWLCGCGNRDSTGAPRAHDDAGADAAVSASPPGFTQVEGGWAFATSEVELAPSEERYICYVAEAPEDMVISAIRSEKNSVVHHFLLVQPMSPERLGFRECNVILQLTWAPLYAATRGTAELRMPPGSAKTLKKGSQVQLQVHMLNTSKEPVKRSVEVLLKTSNERSPSEVGITLFGATNIHLSPSASQVVENTCKPPQDVHLYAIFPHMHYTGRRLELELGKPDGTFESFYKRDPFSFDDQYMDAFDHTIPAGTPVRIRCGFDNHTKEQVDFGESSSDEMCFAIGFTVAGPPLQFCSMHTPNLTDRVPRDPDAGACQVASRGIGQVCTRYGKECGSGLFCSASLLNTDTGYCFQIGCQNSPECGSGNTCCSLPGVGTMANVCMAEACRPDFCIPAELLTPASL